MSQQTPAGTRQFDQGALHSALHAIELVQKGARYLPTIVGAVHGVTSAVSILRKLSPLVPILGLLPRRPRRVLGSIALMGASAAVGAGLGVLLAPESGARTRQRLRRRLAALTASGKQESDAATPRADRAQPEAERPTLKTKPTVKQAAGKPTNGASPHAP